MHQPLWEWALCVVAGILVADRLIPHATALFPALLVLGATALGWRFWIRRFESPPLRGRLDFQKGHERLLAGLALFALAAALHLWRQASDPAAVLARQLPLAGYSVQGEGVVIAEPNERSGAIRVRLDALTMRGHEQRPGATIVLHWPLRSTGYMRRPEVVPESLPRYGDRIRFSGMLRPLPAPRNPGEFDVRTVRARENIYSEVRLRFAEDVAIIDHNCGNWFIARSLKLRAWMERALALGIEQDQEINAVIRSIVLGSHTDASQEIYDLFRFTGTIHLFSVSGLHVAMVASFALFLFQVLRVPGRWLVFAVVPVLWGYAFVTGLAAATIRATIMGSIALIGTSLYRPSLPWNTLGAAAMTILLFDTQQLFRAGFQLSFLLVAALLLGVTPLSRRLNALGQPDPFLPPALWTRWQRAWAASWRAFSTAASVSTVAWIASAPLTLFYFNLFSLSAIPANLMAGTLAWCILTLSLISSFTALFAPGLSILFNNTTWLFTSTLLQGLHLLSSAPGSHFAAAAPELSPPPTEITVLDLNGKAASVLRFAGGGAPASQWLIDCGNRSALRRTLLPFLQKRGSNSIDGLFLTHGDALQIGGAADLLADLPVRELFDTPLKDRSSHRRTIHTLLASGPAGKAILQRGDRVSLAPHATLHILYPPTGSTAPPMRTADDKALVARLDLAHPGTGRACRILFTSDAGFTTEEWLRENTAPEELRADILIKGRHGSDFSGTPAFLDAVQPRLLIASGADFPPSLRIEEKWVYSVEKRRITLLRQDHTGAVTLCFAADGSWQARGFIEGEFNSDEASLKR